MDGVDLDDLIASTIHEAGGVVAAVCHGPAGLLPIEVKEGKKLLAGKRVTGSIPEARTHQPPGSFLARWHRAAPIRRLGCHASSCAVAPRSKHCSSLGTVGTEPEVSRCAEREDQRDNLKRRG